MSDALPTTEQSRGPDGKYTSPTPSLPDATAPDGAVSQDAQDAPVTGSPAPDLSSKSAAQAIFERIAARQQAPDGDGTADVRPPAERENTTAPAPAEAVAKPTAAADKAPAYVEYGATLDRKTGDLLKGARMLLPPDEWKALSVHEQADHIAEAKELRREQQAAAIRRQQPPQNTPPATPAAPAAPPPQSRAPQANTGQTQLESEARGEPPLSGQSAIQLPQHLQDQLAQVAETWGADSAEYTSLLNLSKTLYGEVQNVQIASQQAALKQQHERADRQFEDNIISTFAEAAPSLKNPQLVEELRLDARRQFLKCRERGDFTGFTPEQLADAAARIVKRVVISEVGPEIQQHSAKQQQQRKAQTLAGTVQRGQANTGRPPALTQRESYRAAWDKVQANTQ